MAIQWTNKLESQCSDLWRAGRSAEAVELSGASYCSLINKMSSLGVVNPTNTGQVKQKHYAEDISLMMEMESSGLKHSIIAEYFDLTRTNIKYILCKAKQHGFDRYPRRGND